MRCGVLVCTLAVLSLVPTAGAARRDAVVQAAPTEGAAPLKVTFTANEPVHWDFGDGAAADGTSAVHVFAAGQWTTTWTSPQAGSGTVVITARGVELNAPAHVRYRARATFRGKVVPAQGGVAVRIASESAALQARTRPDGTFRVRTRLVRGGDWVATTDTATSAAAAIAVVPQLRTGLVGSGARGSRYVFAASVRPRDAGQIHVTITRGPTTIADHTFGPSAVRIKLDTRRLTTYRIRARIEPADGFTGALHVLRAAVVLPRVGFGASGSSVALLGQQLRSLHYAAPYTATFDSRMLDAVYAFQKVQGLPRTGVADATFWRRLASPRVAIPRFAQPANHIEVDKTHQVLYIVRGSRVSLIVPVSTAGLPGKFTPVGRFAIYRKVNGFDPSPLGTLYDPMYFTGGYAIHGNPSVPPFPASHGCVRVPMWLAAQLYATNPYGETVYVY